MRKGKIMATPITTVELAGRTSSGIATQIVDVRRKVVFDAAAEVIRDSCRRDPDEVFAWKHDLNRTIPIAVYCVYGHQVSQDIADALTISGFNVRYLEGGIAKWASEGRPQEAKSPESSSCNG
ncbi:rhodanese-like domain-containing protein [Noviherbaspirillum saxi]|uniref:Sulfurtransferase n=1 Tax=Noviherbaspirillum saxi TaxID=2320863 RepID=A0A3A3FQL0_9BURK|nr:sulfurtransferase [Noviherbaspirillum saxi]